MTLVADICATLLVLAMYFSPTALAFSERRRSAVAIAALNAFLGWTIVFWFAALVWATLGASRDQPIAAVEVEPEDPARPRQGWMCRTLHFLAVP